MTQKKKVLIIGAGPAGLTAGVELSKKAHIQPHIVEATPDLGGISRTVDYNGNKLDIGGHRFFTKSDRINDWWDDILPMEDGRRINPDETDEIMLVRDRLSRIYYLSKLFNYPIQLKLETFKNLGLLRSLKIAASYTKSRLSEKKRSEHWKTSSSTSSARNSTIPFSRVTRKRSGASPVIRSNPNGAPSGSRTCRLRKRYFMP